MRRVAILAGIAGLVGAAIWSSHRPDDTGLVSSTGYSVPPAVAGSASDVTRGSAEVRNPAAAPAPTAAAAPAPASTAVAPIVVPTAPAAATPPAPAVNSARMQQVPPAPTATIQAPPVASIAPAPAVQPSRNASSSGRTADGRTSLTQQGGRAPFVAPKNTDVPGAAIAPAAAAAAAPSAAPPLPVATASRPVASPPPGESRPATAVAAQALRNAGPQRARAGRNTVAGRSATVRRTPSDTKPARAAGGASRRWQTAALPEPRRVPGPQSVPSPRSAPGPRF